VRFETVENLCTRVKTTSLSLNKMPFNNENTLPTTSDNVVPKAMLIYVHVETELYWNCKISVG